MIYLILGCLELTSGKVDSTWDNSCQQTFASASKTPGLQYKIKLWFSQVLSTSSVIWQVQMAGNTHSCNCLDKAWMLALSMMHALLVMKSASHACNQNNLKYLSSSITSPMQTSDSCISQKQVWSKHRSFYCTSHEGFNESFPSAPHVFVNKTPFMIYTSYVSYGKARSAAWLEYVSKLSACGT